MKKEAVFGDFSTSNDIEKRAYKAIESGGYHVGDLIDFENAVDACADALYIQREEDSRLFVGFLNLMKDKKNVSDGNTCSFIQLWMKYRQVASEINDSNDLAYKGNED